MILPDFMIAQTLIRPESKPDDPSTWFSGPHRHIVEPFAPRTVQNGMSYGLSAAGYDVRSKQRECFYPGQFWLLSTLEHFWMPDDIVGFVHDKSTWARRGLAVQNTVIEPGWRGHLTLEVTSHARDGGAVIVEAGDPIAQIVFHKMAAPAQSPYAGKYQDQADEPVKARHEQA